MRLKAIRFIQAVLIAGSNRDTIVLAFDKNFTLEMSPDLAYCTISRHQYDNPDVIDAQVIVFASNINRIEPEEPIKAVKAKKAS